MAVTVSAFSIKHNGKNYYQGDIIDKIKESEEKRLVDGGFAEHIEKNIKSAPNPAKGKE